MKSKTTILGASFITLAGLLTVGPAMAYDGTNCEAPGQCWEPKPGFPEKVEGTKYDPKHKESELNKQQESIQAMEKRNAMRVEHFKETGNWVYDVEKLK
ncbi:methanol dehydrogenase [cytochrome c] subunit [Thiohalorhabdus methylotrophus]|uniref:Methanol dehydrogenase [cytochrome c] subunit 2 n=1 Tax=Thiohalorhabdus methylotrophus TaxID=3242694 RepID=A0ABV4TXZ7_9GAMM